MRVKYEFDIHIYSVQEKNIPFVVEMYNMVYTLKIRTYFKKATRWYFTVEAEFPIQLSPEEVNMMKMDTIFRIGYFIKCME